MPIRSGAAVEHFSGEYAFAGIGTWSEPLMTWEHLIDVRVLPVLDANTLSWEDGVVVERGTFSHDGVDTPFVEEWLRMTDDSAEPHVSVSDRSVRIEIGRWALEVTDEREAGPFVATRFEYNDGKWIEVASLLA
jgi:hypothetical protein